MKIFLIIFPIIIFTLENTYSQGEYHVYDSISNPNDFYVLNDSVVVFLDLEREDEELCASNIYTSRMINCVRKGKGPGEFSGNVSRILVDYLEEEIILWDNGNQRLSKFTFDLNLISEESVAGNYRGVLAAFPLDDKKQIVLRLQTGPFAEIVDAENDSIVRVIDDDDILLRPLKENFLLKQGDFALERGKKSIVFVSKYSSTLLKISANEGLTFITLGKPNIPFPENEEEDGYSIPSLHKYVTSSLDVSIENEKIFVLHSGKSTNYKEGFWYMVRGRIIELAEKIESGKEILVYNLKDGSFIKSVELPFEAKEAKIFNDKVYALYDTETGSVFTVVPMDRL